MKERPILFNNEMVRALLEGRKTQTRRLVKANQACSKPEHVSGQFWHVHETGDLKFPYGQPGDWLWVREAHAFVPEPAYRRSTGIYQQINPADDYEACVYRENFDRARSFPWRPSIHMPRWASRLLLEVTAVRVERLQEITAEDASAEGCKPPDLPPDVTGVDGDYEADERTTFAILWNRINGAGSWDANPWVWVVEFKRIDSSEVSA